MRKLVGLARAITGLVTVLMKLVKPKNADSQAKSEAPTTLRIAGYNLILLDCDGEVVWTREWDAGGVFEFGPRYRMWVFCEFTNHSNDEAEVAEYEIELVSEEGLVVERFGSWFSDSVTVMPGQSKVFSGQWRL
jgi:hypothetical protein